MQKSSEAGASLVHVPASCTSSSELRRLRARPDGLPIILELDDSVENEVVAQCVSMLHVPGAKLASKEVVELLAVLGLPLLVTREPMHLWLRTIQWGQSFFSMSGIHSAFCERLFYANVSKVEDPSNFSIGGHSVLSDTALIRERTRVPVIGDFRLELGKLRTRIAAGHVLVGVDGLILPIDETGLGLEPSLRGVRVLSRFMRFARRLIGGMDDLNDPAGFEVHETLTGNETYESLKIMTEPARESAPEPEPKSVDEQVRASIPTLHGEAIEPPAEGAAALRAQERELEQALALVRAKLASHPHRDSDELLSLSHPGWPDLPDRSGHRRLPSGDMSEMRTPAIRQRFGEARKHLEALALREGQIVVAGQLQLFLSQVAETFERQARTKAQASALSKEINGLCKALALPLGACPKGAQEADRVPVVLTVQNRYSNRPGAEGGWYYRYRAIGRPAPFVGSASESLPNLSLASVDA